MKAIVILCVLVVAASGQLSSTRDEDCKDNETFQTCGSACEPSCDAPSPGFCTLQCVVGCQCDKGFLRRSDKACVPKEQCNVAGNTSVPVAPVLPGPLTNMTCGPNEEANACHNPCTEKKCPVKNAPMVNCLMACMNGCSCKSGYLRNKVGDCVKDVDCPPFDAVDEQCNVVDCRTGHKCVVQNGKPVCIPVKPTPISPCATVLCASGTTCQVVNNVAKCVKNDAPPPGITCANVRCGSKGGCGMVEPIGCAPGCKRQPHCLEVNPCNTANCKYTEECVLRQVTCIRAPCNPIAECRPKTNIKPLTLPREPRQTGPSCMTARCATKAGCAMIKPMSCGDDKNCELRPACIEENACIATSCLVGSECVLHEVQCIRAPCNPVGVCEPIEGSGNKRCKKQNETWTDCMTACSDTRCNEEPRFCPAVCRGGGCVCLPGFFRDKSGKCVTQNDCDAQKGTPHYSDTPAPLPQANVTDINTPITPCATMRCGFGTQCQMLEKNCTKPPCETYAACVNATEVDIPLGGCATMKCANGTTCQEALVKCAAPPCPRHAACVADHDVVDPVPSGCATMKCANGTTCQEALVKCAAPPCPTHAACVADHELSDPLPSGCAAMMCAMGTICQEAMVKCAAPPCPSHASCVPDLAQNETMSSCAAVTCPVGETCEETEVQCLMAPCPKVTSCVRHTTPPHDPNFTGCKTVKCAAGHVCIITGWNLFGCGNQPCQPKALCVPDIKPPTFKGCESVKCPEGEFCEEAIVNCVKAPCAPYIACVPDPNYHRNFTGCESVKCPDGEICEESIVNCFQEPCPPYISCVPDPNHRPTVIGCESVRCPSGETCEETIIECDSPPCHPYISCVPDPFEVLDPGCASVSCPEGESCEEREVQCLMAPCPITVSCVPHPLQPAPHGPLNSTSVNCTNVRCSDGQTCKEVKVDCSSKPCFPILFCTTDTVQIAVNCDQVICAEKEVCQTEVFGSSAFKLACVSYVPQIDLSPPDSSAGCAAVTCPMGETCEEKTVECLMAPCPKAVSCVPANLNQNSTAQRGCDVVKCRANEVCEEQQVQCLMAPCPIQVVCVSIVHTNGTAPTAAPPSTCPKNQTMSDCYNKCLESKCLGGLTSMMCTKECNQGCACSPGFVRSVEGNCYKAKDCPPQHNGTLVTAIPPTSCPINQTTLYCLNRCAEDKCPGGESNMMCTKHCSPGCGCAPGFVRSADGECYKSKDCPPEQMCGQNEEYRCEKCAGTCKNPEPKCPGPRDRSCQKKCICAAGFVRKNGKCVTLASCPDHDHSNITCLGTQDYTDCLPKCRQMCSGTQECDTNMHTEMCTQGCVCRPNYKLDSNGDCVHNRHCFKTTNCPANEEWSKCVSDDNICNMATIQKVPLRDQCFSGCICSSGFARNSNGTCVEEAKC